MEKESNRKFTSKSRSNTEATLPQQTLKVKTLY